MGVDTFLRDCRKQQYSEESIQLFRQAIVVAQAMLHEQKRLTGEPEAEHNLRVGQILVENKAAPAVVTAGILHQLPKQKLLPFNSEIVSLVKGVEEIKQTKSKNSLLEAEALRKIILTTAIDPRIIIIELANKLDNLRTIHVLPLERQRKIAAEVLEIYAPLASRLGLDKMRVELENTAFRILHPEKYQQITEFLVHSREQREENIATAINNIQKAAAGNVKIISIKGRPKHIYSIYKKMTVRHVHLDQQYDLLGIRILVPEVKDCYTLLGILHENFEPIEGRLKDYIANPKPNFYRSLHTTIRFSAGNITEIQIRTPEMDEFAEEGIAAHWRYKRLKSEEVFEKKISWLRSILDLEKEIENKEFLKAVKVDLFGDEIHCYTPKGDVKELPQGATVLDFAYAVHEEIGHHAVGGRVNGKFVPLKHKLLRGDVVEIITHKNQRPRRDWLKIVWSSKSQQKIRKLLKEHEKLALTHYHLLKSVVKEEMGVLATSAEYPTAICTLAKCCSPLPGEKITGLATKRRVISVHRTDCRLALKEEERWVEVSWRNTFNQKIRFFVKAEERSGLLADLLHTIASARFEVKEAKAKLTDVGIEECSFLIVPRDLEELKALVQRVQKVKGVKKVYFE